MQTNALALSAKVPHDADFFVGIDLVEHDTKQFVNNVERALELVMGSPNTFQPKFAGWLMANWSVWERFEDQADRAWATGRVHYSARTIIEYIRHETSLRESVNESSGDAFKINNSYVPDLGRLYGMIHPSRADFFECREFKGIAIRTAIRGQSKGQVAPNLAAALEHEHDHGQSTPLYFDSIIEVPSANRFAAAGACA